MLEICNSRVESIYRERIRLYTICVWYLCGPKMEDR